MFVCICTAEHHLIKEFWTHKMINHNRSPTWRSGVVGEAKFTSWNPSRVSALFWPLLQAIAAALRHHTLCRRHTQLLAMLSRAYQTHSDRETCITGSRWLLKAACSLLSVQTTNRMSNSRGPNKSFRAVLLCNHKRSSLKKLIGNGEEHWNLL